MTIEIADRLVALRKGRGLSQEDLAERLGVSRQAISKWERAEASPDLDKLIALSKLYDVTLDELLMQRPGTDAASWTDEHQAGVAAPTRDGTAHSTNITEKDTPNEESASHPPEFDEESHACSCKAAADDTQTPGKEPPKQTPSSEDPARAVHDHVDAESATEPKRGSQETASKDETEAESERTVKDKPKNSVHISLRDGVHVQDEGGDEVHISWKGIHVSEQGGDQVHIGSNGIHVEEAQGQRGHVSGQGVHTEDSDAHSFDIGGHGVFVNGQPVKVNRWYRFPYPVIALGLFLGWGFSGILGGWKLSWLAFLTIPIYYTVVSGICHGKPLQHAFSLIVLLFFFLWGFSGLLGGWLYSWMIFLTIPLYYSMVEAIQHHNAAKFCYPILTLILFLIWGFWGGLGGFSLSWIWFLTIPVYYWICRSAGCESDE